MSASEKARANLCTAVQVVSFAIFTGMRCDKGWSGVDYGGFAVTKEQGLHIDRQFGEAYLG